MCPFTPPALRRPLLPEAADSASGVGAFALALRGRSFSAAEVALICGVVEAFWSTGRTRISEEVCKALDWRQPNGWLKDRACRDVLRTLQNLGHLRLPPSRRSYVGALYQRWTAEPPAPLPSTDDLVTVTSGRVRLEMVTTASERRRWNRLVAQHHYLGYKVSPGRCLKFFVSDDTRLLGAVCLSEAAWAVRTRDQILRALDIPLSRVANNTRFLLLPTVRVPNLASRVLGLLATEGAKAWAAYYSSPLEFLETFVDPIRFKGISYFAANWQCVGNTRGYLKSGSHHSNGQAKKLLFVYPLAAQHRRLLTKMSLHWANSPGVASGLSNTRPDR